MMEWISVEDELPRKSNSEITETVLLWYVGKSKSPYTLGYGVMNDGVNYPFTIHTWHYDDEGANAICGEVTHWMPLPEPPKG